MTALQFLALTLACFLAVGVGLVAIGAAMIRSGQISRHEEKEEANDV